MVLCPACKGRGPLVPVFVVRRNEEKLTEQQLRELCEELGKCRLCDGTNEVTDALAARYERGRAFAAQRRQACYGMREYAEIMKILPSELCDIEQGRCEVPDFVEPPVKTTTLPVRRIWDLQMERDKAVEERDWLRLMFTAKANGLVYENDHEQIVLMSTGQRVMYSENCIPIYDPGIEMQLQKDLEARKQGATNGG